LSDVVGALSLPVAVPDVWPPTDRTLAPGDPALVQLGSFVATVLQADCGTAWEALDPGRPAQPRAIDGVRLGEGVVRRVWFQDPRLGYFAPEDLPGLFVYRTAKADHARFKADEYRRRWPIAIAWLPPRTEADAQRRQRDTFINAVTASLHRNLVFARHRAWVLDSDLAAPTGLLAAALTSSTSLTTITSFDGTLATFPLKPGRPLQISTSVAVGAYNTTDPIIVTGWLDSGATHTDKLYLTSANGGETVVGTWSFATPVSVTIPAQLLTTGSFTIGFYDSPDVKLGSLVQRVCGFLRMEMKGVSTQPIRVAQAVGEPVVHVACEVTVDVTEEVDFDLAEHAEELPDPLVAAGLEAEFAQGNNDPFNAFSL
jgi:hypothetical protein